MSWGLYYPNPPTHILLEILVIDTHKSPNCLVQLKSINYAVNLPAYYARLCRMNLNDIQMITPLSLTLIFPFLKVSVKSCSSLNFLSKNHSDLFLNKFTHPLHIKRHLVFTKTPSHTLRVFFCVIVTARAPWASIISLFLILIQFTFIQISFFPSLCSSFCHILR